jgi:hypothetical protein
MNIFSQFTKVKLMLCKDNLIKIFLIKTEILMLVKELFSKSILTLISILFLVIKINVLFFAETGGCCCSHVSEIKIDKIINYKL